jgi:hypothetical protein
MSRYLFQPDVLLSSQFFAAVNSQAPRKTGEYRLLVALLEDAVERFKKYVLTGDRHFEEAETWIMGGREDVPEEVRSGSTFSFPYVCGVLGFDPDHVRHGLRRWRSAQKVQR